MLDCYNETSTKLSNLRPIPSATQNDIKQYLDKKDVPTGTVLKGVGQGKNLIVIQV